MDDRLAQIIEAFYPKAINGDVDAAGIVLRAMELQAEIYT
jgi:hypothetical protein